jgi:alpha-mannosidase
VPTRRQILKAGASLGAATAAARLFGEAQTQPTTAPTSGPAEAFYYVDGYHGGVDGHMPPTSLPNVLDGLDKFPHWKVSFEIEPYSWAVFAKSDPKSIERLREHLKDATPAARVELVSGAYGQPYAWNISGECNIRQLLYGRAELHAMFPDLIVDTYAVQEPCWTSCLPQLLKSLGYKRAVLKNSTCWCGYHAATFDADVIHWTSADGTSLPTVPRYACENLTPPATLQGAQPTPDFLRRCRAAGIPHPAGTILQDMGWAGRPWRFAMNEQVARGLRQVTWREYVETIATPPTKHWRATQEDLRVGLAWGASVLQRIAQMVRASEGLLIQAEKMASMATVLRGALYPKDELDEAWKNLLWSQHHDVWIVSYNRHKTGTWASVADEKFELITQACAKIIEASSAAQAGSAPATNTGKQSVRVFNTTGFRRRDLAAFELPASETRREFQVRDSKGNPVPCQLVGGQDKKSASTLLFPAEVPAMGYATYSVEAIETPAPAAPAAASATTRPAGYVILESDLYRLSIDPAKGGRIDSLYSKELRREFVDVHGPRGFNEFRGYFSSAGGWLSSLNVPAAVMMTEDGPLRKTARIDGKIGAWPFSTTVSLVAGQRRIDFQTTLDLPVDSPPFGRQQRGQFGSPPSQQPSQPRFRVGEPWEPGHNTVGSGRRPQYDSSYKLQVLFPAALERPTLYKNAPFDVCQAASLDTRFNSWDSIKNNIVVNWLDLVQADGAAGLAVMTDHTTSYSITPGEPLGLVACYAGPGVWFDYNLGRTPRLAYSIVPHAGDWAQAQLWRELSRWSEPLLTKASSESGAADTEWSLIDASSNGLEISAVLIEKGHLLIRLFNAEGDGSPTQIALSPRIKSAELIELDGRLIADLPIGRNGSGQPVVTVSMPRFAARTLRYSLKNPT